MLYKIEPTQQHFIFFAVVGLMICGCAELGHKLLTPPGVNLALNAVCVVSVIRTSESHIDAYFGLSHMRASFSTLWCYFSSLLRRC